MEHNVNNKVKQSKFKILLIISIIMVIEPVKQNRNFGFVDAKNITMDYTIYPSTIPESQLLRIEEAEKLYHRAFDSGKYYGVRDPDALVELIKHAWQWDKNAMSYYYDILRWHDLYDENRKQEGMMSFTEFMKKYRDQLIDNTGKPLIEPVVFKDEDMEIYLRKKFADLKYPKFAYESWHDCSDILSDHVVWQPCSDEQLEKNIKYLNYALEGGYHCYKNLTANMLFQQGDHYKDSDHEKINKLTEYRKSLTLENLKLAIDYAEIMAEHSSIIGILRVTEAYLYGLGREQDPVKAYAWSLLNDYARQKLIELDNNFAWDYYQLPPVWEYNEQIQTRLKQNLSPLQKQAAQKELAGLKTKIIDWNYNRWEEQIDDFHPKP